MSSPITFIYTLSDPRTGLVRYVGKTEDPAARIKTHRRKEATHKGCWVQSLLKEGLEPIMEILDEVSTSEWRFWEQYWIQVMCGWGFQLTNGDRGGLGRGRMTPEIAAKISKTLTGRTYPARQKQIHQYDIRGEYVSSHDSVTKAAQHVGGSQGNLGAVAISRKMAYGFLWSYEKVEKVNRALKPAMSQETRDGIRQRATGRQASVEARAKMRDARLGKPPANKGKAPPAWVRAKNREACTTRREVAQLSREGDVIAKFPSIKDAANATGATRSGIYRTANGGQEHAAGFKWSFDPETYYTISRL